MTRTPCVCLAFVLAALSSPTAHGFCLEHPTGTGGTLPKAYWPNMPVTFKIHNTGSATGPLGATVQPDQASEFAAVRAAFTQWAGANCASIQFTDGGLIDATEVVNLQHTANEIRVYWARDMTEWGISTTTSIARTFYVQDGTGKITAAGILLNAMDKSFSTTGAGDRYDVQSVVATEVGRVLGLAAVSDSAAVMYPSFQMGSTTKRTLTADDMDGAAFLYSSGSCALGTPDTNCQGTPQQDGGTTQEDGGSTQQDGGGGQHDGGGTGDGGTGDGGGQTCEHNSDCASNRCDIDTHMCVSSDDGGCSCTVGAAGRGGYLVLSLGCLGLALALGLRRRRR
jgi:MYXO-CTERM domain-containing protein